MGNNADNTDHNRRADRPPEKERPSGQLGRLEEALNKSENQCRALLEDLNVGVFQSTMGGDLVYANPAFVRLVGLSAAEDVLRMPITALYRDPADRDRLLAMLFERGSVENFEIRAAEGTTKSRWVSLTAILQRDEAGDPRGVLGIVQDIDERKRAQNALQAEEERYRSLISRIQAAIVVHDRESRVVASNPKAQELLGLTSEQMDGVPSLDPLWKITDENGDPLTPDQYPVSRTLQTRKPVKDLICGLVTPGRDELTWVLTSTDPVFDGAGEILQVIVTFMDITAHVRAETALKESESRFRGVVEASPDPIVLYDLNGDFLSVNQKASEIVGFSCPDEFLEHVGNIADVLDEGQRDQAFANFSLTMRSGISSKNEYTIRRVDGTSFPAEVSSAVVRKADGEPLGFISIVRDLSARKEAEAKLRESEERYRDLFDNSADLIYTHDLNGAYTSVNKAVERLLGYVPEEFLNLTYRDVVDPGFRGVTEHNLRLKSEDGLERTEPYEVLAVKKSGEPVWLEVNSRAMYQHGRCVGIHGTARDITDRKRAEEQLKRLFAAVEQADETIMVTDSEGVIQYVNPAFEKTSGYRRREAIGKIARMPQPTKQDPNMHDNLWATIRSGETWRGRFNNRRKDGTLYEETATISPIRNHNGTIIDFVAVKRDVTMESTLQKQLVQAQKMEAIGTLAGGVAHDFNNLLMVILGYADLLIQLKQPDDPDCEKLAAVRAAARDGSDLVKRILTFSRQVESKVRPIDLNEEIRRIEKLLLRTLPKMIDIQLSLSEDVNTINADPAQIEQAVLNLAVNAHHAMPDGGKLVIETANVFLSNEYCATHMEAEPGEYVLLSISDTGVGIAPEILDRVFDPFFTTKENGQGTGLGLSMVHGIVAQHGGYVMCYSEPNIGTTFKLYFPPAVTASPFHAAPTSAAPAFGSETILLVDDDVRIRELAAEMLVLAGYDVVAAANGQEALDIYKDRGSAISLIILDLIMPGMSGSQCLKALLEMDPNVNVLISSGYSADGPIRELTGAGAKGFISKPYDTQELFRTIRSILDESAGPEGPASH